MPIIGGLGSLFAGTFLLMTAQGLLHTVLGLRLDAMSGPGTVGVVMSGYFAGLTIGSLHAAKVIHRVGHIRAYAAFSSILAAATLAHTFVAEGYSWAPLRVAQGFCMAGLFMCLESWLNQRASNVSRGALLSVYMVAVYGGLGTGQLFLMFAEPGSGYLLSLCALLVSLAVVPVALTRATGPSLPDVTSFGPAKLYSFSPLGVVLTVSSGLIMGAIYGIGPVFARRAGFTVQDVSLFMSALMLGGFALQFPIGRLSDSVDRRRVLLGLLLAFAAISLIIGKFISTEIAATIVLAVALGGVAFTIYPLAVAHINDFVEPSDMVSAAGGIVLIYSAGAVVGPIVAVQAMNAMGPSGFTAYLSVVGVAAAVFTFWRIWSGPPIPATSQSSYQAIPRTTPIASVLHPGGEVPEDETGSH